MATHPVVLRLYDLSQGMARELSPSLLGQQIDGIWHTGVFVFGREYFFGGGGAGAGSESGISSADGSEFTMNQGIRPVREIPLGRTARTRAEFEAFLRRVAGRFRCCDYSLFHHNCNNFSDEVARFLVGSPIPDFITGLPARVLATPMGAAIKPLMDNFNNNFQSQIATPQAQQRLHHYGALAPAAPPTPSSGGVRGNDEAEAAAALDAALAALADPPEAATATTTVRSSRTTTTGGDGGGSEATTTTTTTTTTVTATAARASACPVSVFADASLVPGMVRRLTNLSSHFTGAHPNFEATLKAAFISLQQPAAAAAAAAASTAPLRALVPLLETVLRGGVPRAVLPAAYLLRLLCLHRELFPAVASESGVLDWCAAVLGSRGALERQLEQQQQQHLPQQQQQQHFGAAGPAGLSPVAAASVRTMVFAALANLCSHRPHDQAASAVAPGTPSDVVRHVLWRANDDGSAATTTVPAAPRLDALRAAGELCLPPRPAAPHPHFEAQAEAERAACLALLSNLTVQVNRAAAGDGPTRTDATFQRRCRHAALELLVAAAAPLCAEEQATDAAVQAAPQDAPPPLLLLVPPGARRDASEICTELLHCVALQGDGKADARRALAKLGLAKAARGNARRMAAAAAAGGEGAQERREKSQIVSGALFVQIMKLVND